jgi:hypothetical protein
MRLKQMQKSHFRLDQKAVQESVIFAKLVNPVKGS